MNKKKEGALSYVFPENGFRGKSQVKGVKYVFADNSELHLMDTNGKRYFFAQPSTLAAKFMNRVCVGTKLTSDEKALKKEMNDVLDATPAQIVDCGEKGGQKK